MEIVKRVFTVEIELENDAFEWSGDQVSGCEISRILEDLAKRIDTSFNRQGFLKDINGNTVGSFNIIEKEIDLNRFK